MQENQWNNTSMLTGTPITSGGTEYTLGRSGCGLLLACPGWDKGRKCCRILADDRDSPARDSSVRDSSSSCSSLPMNASTRTGFSPSPPSPLGTEIQPLFGSGTVSLQDRVNRLCRSVGTLVYSCHNNLSAHSIDISSYSVLHRM